MSEELLIRIFTLGIPFVIGLFVPKKSKSQIDAETKKKIDAKFPLKD